MYVYMYVLVSLAKSTLDYPPAGGRVPPVEAKVISILVDVRL